MALGETIHKWTQSLGLSAAAPLRNAEALLAVLILALLASLVVRKLLNTLLTLRATAFAPTLSRRLSDWVKSLSYSEQDVWGADGAGEGFVRLRQDAINRLAGFFRSQSAKSIAWGNDIRESFSDLRFTDANRVPFPFMQVMREKFSLCSVVTESKGPRLRDLDGNWSLDVSGSYGLNVAGFD